MKKLKTYELEFWPEEESYQMVEAEDSEWLNRREAEEYYKSLKNSMWDIACRLQKAYAMRESPEVLCCIDELFELSRLIN